MSHNVPAKFTGYAAQNEKEGKAFQCAPHEFEPPTWNEDCVDIKISACGVCGSCVHTITSGWGAAKYPCVVGHEICGTVVRAGKNSGHKEGARVGVGAQGGSCGKCEMCKDEKENLCMGGMIGTYQGTWPDGKSYTMGGYADYHRTFGRFAVPVPEELSDVQAAPLFCAGVTTYTPLAEAGVGPGKKVAIVGIGGLGHYGLQWSNALGAETYAVSHSHSKEEDCARMGVDKAHFITTDNVEECAKKWKMTFDFILVTNNQKNPPLAELYIPMLRPQGKVVFVGLSEEPLPRLPASSLTVKAISVGGSIIGSPKQIKEMLALAVKKNVKSWVQERPMSETGAALKDLDQGKARYRFVLVNPK